MPATATSAAASVAASVSAAAPVASVAKAHIGDQVFDESKVHAYYPTFSETEYAKLMNLSTLLLGPRIVNEDRYVRAALRVDDTEFGSIAVRFKGQFSIWGCVDGLTGARRMRVEPFFGNIDVWQRFSLKLDFNKYEPGARLDGLKQLNLHAMAASCVSG